jgi:hypothetical protein
VDHEKPRTVYVTLHSFLSSSLHAGEWPATHPRLLYHLGKTRGRLRLKCDDTRAETRFRLSAKRTSPFKSAGASVQSTVGSRGVRIGGSNAGYTMFRGSVKSTDYPLHSPVSPSLSLPYVTVCHHISTGLYISNDIHNRSLRNRVELWTGFVWLVMCPIAGCCG